MEITRNNRYSQVEMPRYTPIIRQTKYPEGWETGLSSDEFLLEAKKMLKKKFDDRD